jgi:hydrogenase expression/formation protein HypE
MQAGKLPSDILSRLIAGLPKRDARVLLGPGIGRDAAVIDNGGPKLLIAKSDPITFASDMIGRYAVHVNANDIACTGATPCWFLATILLPEGSTHELAESIFGQIQETCTELGIEIVGGHTEITIGLDRPIVAGAMLGEAKRDRLVRPDGARPGDALILTKGIAIEGTSVLAHEAASRLADLGVSRDVLGRASAYILSPGISVVAEAKAACSAVEVHAMHDPTEGGLATALHEMAEASGGVGITIEAGAVDVLPETQAVCEAAGLDPLGLLASGSLLVAVADHDCDSAMREIESAGVPARRLGTITEKGAGVIMMDEEGTVVPRFATDEVARFLSGTGSPSDNPHPKSEGEED